jgi:multiple antibiotic resistance protein
VTGFIQTFLLALSALFSIVNPIGAALIFSQVTADRSRAERAMLARKIGLYSALVMLCALWAGAAILNFFGVSLAALRIAGGLIVTANAWVLLQAPERNEDRKQEQASQSVGTDEVAFFPLTMPFTTGPGTIAVAIALGSNLPVGQPGYAAFVLGASLAATVIALGVWVAYAWADTLVSLLGQARARIMSRLAAFLLLCVGTQITLNGIRDFVSRLKLTGGPSASRSTSLESLPRRRSVCLSTFRDRLRATAYLERQPPPAAAFRLVPTRAGRLLPPPSQNKPPTVSGITANSL